MERVSTAAISRLISRLSLLRFFPSGEDQRQEIAESVEAFAFDNEQLAWLGKRMIALYSDWPGVHELRAVFCSRFPPRDRVEGESSVFPEGVPRDPALGRPPQQLLPAGHVASVSGELDKSIQDLAMLCTMPAPMPRVEVPPVSGVPATEKCARCGNIGVLPPDNAFCDCQMGIDLRQSQDRRLMRRRLGRR